MWKLLDLGIVVLCSLFVIIFSTACIIIFFENIWGKFKIKVNCWFCNTYSKVPYQERNSFYCVSCKQYNGFKEDGSYNKCIPEQYDEMLNARPQISKHNKSPASNGLCKICNNNQQLKIYQLANFIPLNEDNYNVEIEHFEKQLEKAYKLCPKCSRIVKKTILKQNKWMLGLKISKLKKNGLAMLNRNNGSLKATKYLTFLFLLMSILIASYLIYTKFDTASTYKKLTIDLVQENFFALYDHISIFDVVQRQFSHYYKSISKSPFTLNLCVGVTWILMISIPISIVLKYRLQRYIKNKKEVALGGFKTLRASRPSRIPCSSYSDNEPEVNSSSRFNSSDISTDTIESDFESFNKVLKHKKKIKSPIQNYATMPVFGQKALLENSLNKSPISFNELNDSFTSVKSSISQKPSVFNSHCDLNLSLTNLKLNPNVIKQKPILSPPKLRNPWTGRCWEREAFSRSSSQSSGIFSSYLDNSNFNNSQPNSQTNSLCGDFDCSSLVSEPIYAAQSGNTRNLFQTNRFKPIVTFSEVNSLNSFRSNQFNRNKPAFDTRSLNDYKPVENFNLYNKTINSNTRFSKVNIWNMNGSFNLPQTKRPLESNNFNKSSNDLKYLSNGFSPFS